MDKVRANNSSSGESSWVPEDSIKKKSLSVLKNGIYYAADEDYTAYDTVTVNVSSESVMGYSVVIVNVKPTQVTGIDVFDGKTYTVIVDSNGNLVRTLVE